MRTGRYSTQRKYTDIETILEHKHTDTHFRLEIRVCELQLRSVCV